MIIDPMLLVLVLGATGIGVSFWRAHRRPDVQFNLLDLLLENGRVSKISFAFMLVLGVSTWVVVDLQVKGRLTDGTFGLWLGAWVAPLVARVVFGKTEMPAPGAATGAEKP